MLDELLHYYEIFEWTGRGAEVGDYMLNTTLYDRHGLSFVEIRVTETIPLKDM